MLTEQQRAFGLLAIILIFVLTIGGCGGCKPDPVPPPEPPPDTKTLAGYTAAIARAVPGVTPAEARTLAANYKRVSEQIAKFEDPLNTEPVPSVPALLNALNTTNRQILGARFTAWEPFFLKLETALDAMEQQQLLQRSIFGIGAACGEIAKGLEAV